MAIIIKNISSLVTVNSESALYKIGEQMQDIGEIKNGAMIVSDVIEWIGETSDLGDIISRYNIDQEIDLKGKTVLPGLVDSHTHIVFGGNRSAEFGQRLRGATYAEIAEAGGGIQTTVNATRNASVDELAEVGRGLALSAAKYGTTSLEVKSGYSLTVEGEIKQLEAIKKLKETLPLRITPTFMGAHDFPKESKGNRKTYIDQIINEMLPLVAENKLAEFNDVFVDKGYYTTEEGTKVLEAGKEYGLLPKAHCDELADVGAATMAANAGAISADHLLFVSDEGIANLKKSGTVAGLLPGTAYFIKMPYAPARKLIDSGVITAIATDCNPGSCFTENMQTIMSLSVINMGMTAEEAISAATINGAYSIRKSHEVGSLEVGKKADFIVCNCNNYIDIFYHFGINHVEQTWINGKQII
ncbi:MAG: imidazolonepropionase [Ignavibacteriae bacterium]|nr:imidazolonepropionase [Ignavibacteriota bacterium]MCB9222119.1 imidazolonepropionase [Ignavibacteria bacterium]